MATETLDQYKKRVAASGGRAVVAKRGKEYMRNLGKKGASKRWPKSNIIKKLFKIN